MPGLIDFSDPYQMQGLIAGLAQAAMPSRLPVPTGAAFGMGLQGAMQGRKFGLEMQQGQQGLQKGSQELAQGKLGLMQNLAAINYYRQRNGLPPVSMQDLAGTDSKKLSIGLSSDSPQREDTTPTAAAVSSLTQPQQTPVQTADGQSATPSVFSADAPPPAAPQPAPQGILGQSIQPPAIQQVESGGDPNAVSPAGARGPMQLMPATAAQPGFGVHPAADGSAAENQRVGADYYSALTKHYGGNQVFASIAYNWGPGNTDKWLSRGAKYSELPSETRDYLGHLAVTSAAKSPIGQGAPAPEQVPAVAPVGAGPAPSPAPNPLAGLDQIGMFNPQAALQAQLKFMEPQNVRPGGSVTAMNPQTGKYEQYYYQPVLEKNTTIQDGRIVQLPGGNEATANQAYAAVAGGKQAELQYDPSIAGGKKAAELAQALHYNPAIAAGEAAGRAAVEDAHTLIDVYDPVTQQTLKVPRAQILAATGPVASNAPGATAAPAGQAAQDVAKTTAGVTIPRPPAMQRPGPAAAGPSFGQQATQKAVQGDVDGWFNNYQQNAQAEQRTLAMADALKQIQSGAWTEHRAEIARQLEPIIGAGAAKALAGADPAQAQILVKNNFGTALSTMKGITNRVTEKEIFAASKNLANPSLEPGANQAILGQVLGVARYNMAQRDDWLAAQRAGWTDPAQFEAWWQKQPQHSLESFVQKAQQQIGPLKGMPGGPGSSGGALPANLRMQLKQGTITSIRGPDNQVHEWTLDGKGQPAMVQ